MVDVYPCHSKPKSEWCDRDGPAGFMGHTCQPPSFTCRGSWALGTACGRCSMCYASASAEVARLKALLSDDVLSLRDDAVRQIERARCEEIVINEWHKAVSQFELRPGTVVETYSGRVLNRIRGID